LVLITFRALFAAGTLHLLGYTFNRKLISAIANPKPNSNPNPKAQ